ncbi:carbamoyl-phosphate synthase small subunit [Robertmurraya siralis]|uniref:Carbamoyl-phosphate synthase small subunit n=1 Tax=Robertmurraya siralis TaxID=77777 RepID=A0A919WLS3_9BACI|nr:ATP-grasp domain-containing protein [Robertmurraya siralis]GIN64058.1 carbamoyl-phosphate synthase small subunit [Robertmurraya siralis]
MGSILILGTGSAQKDLINYCIDAGHKVYACSNKKSIVAQNLGDRYISLDIKNGDAIVDFVKEKDIDYVYSIGSDIAMPTIAKTSKALNLSCFISEKTAIACHYKSLFRRLIPSKFNINFLEVKDEQELNKWDIFPCIIKPTDSQGQRGVYKCLNRKQLVEHFNQAMRFSPSKSLIVEEYVQGDEISVNAYVVNKKLVLSFISDRITYKEYPGGIVKEHIFPSKYEKNNLLKEKILSLVERCSSSLGIKNGPIYFQIKITKELNVKLIEITPRLDGCHLWRIIEITYGVNLLDITMRHLLNKNFKDINRNGKKVNVIPHSLKFLSQRPGTLMGQYDVSQKDKKVKYVDYFYNKGDCIQSVNGHMEKVGYYIVEE